jgi:hypothetical protein
MIKDPKTSRLEHQSKWHAIRTKYPTLLKNDQNLELKSLKTSRGRNQGKKSLGGGFRPMSASAVYRKQ